MTSHSHSPTSVFTPLHLKTIVTLTGITIGIFTTVATSGIIGSGFRVRGDATITSQYTLQGGVNCSNTIEYGQTVSGINDWIFYSGGRPLGSADICPNTVQYFDVTGISSTLPGNNTGGIRLTCRIRENNLFSVHPARTINMSVEIAARGSVISTSFGTGTIIFGDGPNAGQGLTHLLTAPNFSTTEYGTYDNMMIWPGIYTAFVNGNVFFQHSGQGTALGELTTTMSITITDPNISPPPCTGANRCADYNNDGNFDISDLYGWYASPMDVTGDELFDADPYSEDATWIANTLLATDETLSDCNENGFPDVYDIFIGDTSGGNADINHDGIPDECQCVADLSGNGTLNFFDINLFLTAFNAQDPTADFSDDGLFDFFDISAFLQAFAAGCP